MHKFLSWALRNAKRTVSIFNVTLVLEFCPLKTEISRFPIGFHLKDFTFYYMYICSFELSFYFDLFC